MLGLEPLCPTKTSRRVHHACYLREVAACSQIRASLKAPPPTESQVWAAEAAASLGDQRSLYLIVRRLSPKQRHIAGRLRGEDGRLLSSQEEVQLMTAYGNQTFAACPDASSILPLAQDINITDQDLHAELRKPHRTLQPSQQSPSG